MCAAETDSAIVERLDPSLYPVLRPVVLDLRSVLSRDLVAVWLTGSAAAGAFTPGVSDVDLIVVTERPVATLDLAALDAVHRRVVERDAAWANRLEVVYVAVATLAELRPDHRLAVVSPGEPFHLTGPASDWLQNWYLAREDGIALHGPEPNEVIPAIAETEFRGAIRHYLDHIRGAGPSGYAVLSACRCLRVLETGVHGSKEEAVTWCRARFPEWASLIDAAWADRHAPRARAFDDPARQDAARRFVRRVAADAGLEEPPGT